MTITEALLIFSAAFNLFLGFFIFVKDRRNASGVVYFVIASFFAAWGFVHFTLYFFHAYVPAGRFFFLPYIPSSFLLPAFLIFSYVFPGREFRVPRWVIAATAIPVAVAIGMAVVPGVVIQGAAITNGVFRITPGPFYPFFAAYIFFYFFWSFSRFFLVYAKTADPKTKSYIRIILISGLGAAVPAVTTNLVLPAIGMYSLFWFGPVATLAFSAGIAYGIIRHNLLDIRVFATQVFVTIIIFMLLIRTLVSRSLNDFFINALLFLVISFLGRLLIRTSLQEVRDKERIAELAAGLEKSNEELRMLDQAKSEFISIASHQLRTPLVVIRDYVSMLMEGDYGSVSGQARETLTKLFSAATQLIALVRDMLDLSRIEAGKMTYDFTTGDFAQVVGETVDELRPVAQEKGLSLALENTIAGRAQFSFDRDRMKQMVTNLIDNAIKYSSRGTVRIALGEAGKNRVRLSVSDQGIGIEKGDVERLFKKFARTEESMKLDPKGLGIGLYFVKRVVEDHGGKTWAESPGIGLGSTFFVELPMRNRE